MAGDDVLDKRLLGINESGRSGGDELFPSPIGGRGRSIEGGRLVVDAPIDLEEPEDVSVDSYR